MKLEKYSLGIGDRFGQQGPAQLKALIQARDLGIEMVPVWNKSNREHQIVRSSPKDTLLEAETAVRELNWEHPYYVDADHINLKTVDPFLDYANFFTLDVAGSIGSGIKEHELREFLEVASAYAGKLAIPGIKKPFTVSEKQLIKIAGDFLAAVREAEAIYTRIAGSKGADNFIAEISMDEVEEAQTPAELFFILMMISHYEIPAQTIAPKFTGRFNKGVDYEGDVKRFRKEFEENLLVIDFAVKSFGLPPNLKLSVHSGSDKFTIYPVMGELIKKHNAGIHVKTAGTTWLEELVGLAMAGGDALQMAGEIYRSAYERREELCGPYQAVIDIDAATLPDPEEVLHWNSQKFATTLRHIPGHPNYHPGFRQLLHVGYKVAAEMGEVYLTMIRSHGELIGEQVRSNIFERHIQRLF
ncbi:MAG: tagaturonate epimerase family protein [Bacteroidales bacterium]|nr:tagaturonate epimerase family protein [Bacteroidales bacterium]